MQVKRVLPAIALSLSVAGVGFIQSWEGTERVAYLDSVGVPTICTGSTKGVYVGQKASLAECEHRLIEDTTYAGKAIQRCVREKITQANTMPWCLWHSISEAVLHAPQPLSANSTKAIAVVLLSSSCGGITPRGNGYVGLRIDVRLNENYS